MEEEVLRLQVPDDPMNPITLRSALFTPGRSSLRLFRRDSPDWVRLGNKEVIHLGVLKRSVGIKPVWLSKQQCKFEAQ